MKDVREGLIVSKGGGLRGSRERLRGYREKYKRAREGAE